MSELMSPKLWRYSQCRNEYLFLIAVCFSKNSPWFMWRVKIILTSHWRFIFSLQQPIEGKISVIKGPFPFGRLSEVHIHFSESFCLGWGTHRSWSRSCTHHIPLQTGRWAPSAFLNKPSLQRIHPDQVTSLQTGKGTLLFLNQSSKPHLLCLKCSAWHCQ